jgi:hypothetical protein
VDEIDLLVSDKVGRRMTFGIIGISNSVENFKAHRLYNLGGVRTSLASSIQRPFFAPS